MRIKSANIALYLNILSPPDAVLDYIFVSLFFVLLCVNFGTNKIEELIMLTLGYLHVIHMEHYNNSKKSI